MYLTIKLLIDFSTFDGALFHKYEKIFSDEAKRVANFAKRTGNEMDSKNISSLIHYRSILHVMSESRRVAKLKRVNDNYIVSPIWNPGSYHISGNKLRLLFGTYFTQPYMDIELLIRDYQKERLRRGKWRSLKIKRMGKYYYVYLTLLTADPVPIEGDIKMGVDLGVRVPAVCVTSNHKVKFVGNGRYIRFIERSLRAKYKKLDIAKRKDKIKKMNHKLARTKYYLDHKYAREIIDFAKENQVSVIKLERLKGIQEHMVKARYTQMYHWSYHQMQSFIAQKAKQEGINIIYINPNYTSQICPNCLRLNKPKGREYRCSCGFHNHRDLVGAMNILHRT